MFDGFKYRKLLRYRYDLPWPLSNRESILFAKYIPLTDLNSMLAVMNSPNQPNFLGMPLPDPEKFTRMSIPLGGCLLKSTGPDQCEITFLSQTNSAVVIYT